MRMNLQYVKSASAAIYINELKGYDNDLFVTQILSRGDKQNRQSNVKADMTEWKVNEVEWYNLLHLYLQLHLIHDLFLDLIQYPYLYRDLYPVLYLDLYLYLYLYLVGIDEKENGNEWNVRICLLL